MSVVTAIIVSSASYNLFSNYLLGTACLSEVEMDNTDLHNADICHLSWTTKLSLANKRDMLILMEIQGILNLFTIVTIIVLLFQARIKFAEIAEAAEMQNHLIACPSEFAVFIEQLPNKLLGLMGKSVERLISNRFGEIFDLHPIAVHICWNLSELQDIQEEGDEKILAI